MYCNFPSTGIFSNGVLLLFVLVLVLEVLLEVRVLATELSGDGVGMFCLGRVVLALCRVTGFRSCVPSRCMACWLVGGGNGVGFCYHASHLDSKYKSDRMRGARLRFMCLYIQNLNSNFSNTQILLSTCMNVACPLAAFGASMRPCRYVAYKCAATMRNCLYCVYIVSLHIESTDSIIKSKIMIMV